MTARPAVHHVAIVGGSSFDCADGERVLVAMERAGYRDILVGCRGGGCGVCRVRVLAGAYRRGKMSKTHIDPEQERKGFALACRLYPAGDLLLEVRVPHPQPEA